jgi:hypothetical protein
VVVCWSEYSRLSVGKIKKHLKFRFLFRSFRKKIFRRKIMKGLSLKRIVSFVVVAAMLLALLAVPAMADEKVINVGYANIYPSDATQVIAWASSDSAKTVESIYSDGTGVTFTWWAHALLELNAESGLYEVTAVSSGTADYTSWTLGTGKVVLSAHDDCADATSLANLKALKVGDKLALNGVVEKEMKARNKYDIGSDN